MKKFLITTVLGIATTAAFGAASLRAPQIGGTATVTTPTATNTARAGTMRAQTMKTSSVSTPASVTTTQSIATPVSTETTDARIALLKGIKGFNPGKIKDTTTAQQELNAIDSRIEELTAQLDRAEAAQNTVLTEANVNDKITASVTEKTYTKTEIDNLLNDIKRKLPTLDDRGSVNMNIANESVSVPRYYYNLIDLIAKYDGLVTRYVYETNAPYDKAYEFAERVCQAFIGSFSEDFCDFQYYSSNNTFVITKRDYGYYLKSSDLVSDGNSYYIRKTYAVNDGETNVTSLINSTFCANRTFCNVEELWNNFTLYGAAGCNGTNPKSKYTVIILEGPIPQDAPIPQHSW